MGDRYLGGIKEATVLEEDKGSGQALMNTQGNHTFFPQGFESKNPVSGIRLTWVPVPEPSLSNPILGTGGS